MKPQNSTSTILIEHPDVAEFLLNYATQKLLHPFMGQEESIANAAQALEMSISALLYRVQKLQQWEIIHIVREEKRAGRATKIYTATAESYFIPFGVTRAETLERYLTETKQHFEQLLTHNIAAMLQRTEREWGMRVYRDETGSIRTQMATYPDQVIGIEQMDRAILDFYYPGLQLNQEDAKALQRELGELVQKYAQKAGKQQYLLHIGLTPLVRE